jgi:hypothetical protein
MIGADLSPMTAYAQFVEEFGQIMQSPKNTKETSEWLSRATSAAFNTYADGVASRRRRELFHVYEPGMVGDPSGRLWNINMTGVANNKVISWKWKAATQPNLVGKYAPKPIPKDTRQRVHIFVWKAPILETGATVVIPAPTDDKKALAFPRQGEMGFSKVNMTVHFRYNAGNFTELWESYWAGLVEEVLKEDYVKTTEDIVHTQVPAIIAKMPKSKRTLKVKVLPPPRWAPSEATKLKLYINSGYKRVARARENLSRSRNA